MILAQCISPVKLDCNRSAVAYNILPPIISARLTTVNNFSFRYGRVEIRAKFPAGVRLYPELWLQPKNPVRNSGFTYVRVCLGMTRGNRVLTGNNKTYGGQLLEFGLRAGSAPNFQLDVTVQKVKSSENLWTSGVHVYSTTWTADGFVFHVDGEEVGRLNPGPNGWFSPDNHVMGVNKIAPFDGQFYITLGVGVGGVRDFPDNTRSGGEERYDKPWINVAAKAMLRFWQAEDQWLPSWRCPNAYESKLQIDYVRVWTI